MVLADTNAGFSYINSKLENMKKYHFKYDIPKANLNIAKWINEISVSGKPYS